LVCPNVSRTVFTPSGHLTGEPSTGSIRAVGKRDHAEKEAGPKHPVAFTRRLPEGGSPYRRAMFGGRDSLGQENGGRKTAGKRDKSTAGKRDKSNIPLNSSA
jgi:hypothetical protein